MFKIINKYTQANIPKTVRFTEEINEKLYSMAQKENISFNELVLRCCQYAIENYEPNDEQKENKKI